MITSNPELAEFLQHIKSSEVIAVDTEFLRVNTFYSTPCLLQVASDNIYEAIDLQADLDLSELFTSLYNKVLVFHSARQDLEILYNLCGKLPTRIFDTQIFAHFLGFARQISYGNLVAEILGVHLDKAYAHFDWSIRPLPKEVIKYALDDVIYLIKLHNIFKDSQFYTYATQDCMCLLDKHLYTVNPEESYKYLKGRNRLNEPQFTLAVRLSAYRELRASATNTPRKWVLTDDEILKMATTGDIPEKIKRALPIINDIKYKNYHPPTLHERNEVKRYEKCFEEVAIEYNLSAELFASKKEIVRYIRNETKPLFCRGWRKKLLKGKL